MKDGAPGTGRTPGPGGSPPILSANSGVRAVGSAMTTQDSRDTVPLNAPGAAMAPVHLGKGSRQMVRYYTHYWVNQWLEHKAVTEGEVLSHDAGNQFRTRGIKRGDFVYVVTVREGDLYLMGRPQVGEVCSQERAIAKLGPDLWDANDHLIAESGSETPMRADVKAAPEVAKLLTFVTSDGKDALGHPVEHMKLQAIRELDRYSADRLDQMFGSKRRETPVDTLGPQIKDVSG